MWCLPPSADDEVMKDRTDMNGHTVNLHSSILYFEVNCLSLIITFSLRFLRLVVLGIGTQRKVELERYHIKY